MRLSRLFCLLLCVCPLSAQPYPAVALGGLEWRMIGPHRGGRSVTAAGVPGSSTYYFGAVGGGIWKSVNAGETWNPVFDGQPVASIGALAIAASDPRIIYAGTGEADIRSDLTFGNGVYKTTDAGKTWRNVGLRDTRQIGRVIVDPGNPEVVFVAALGHAYGPNAERGVFRSRDGGRSWQKVLFKDADTGAIDIAFEPGNPRVLYAALWQAKRTPWSQYQPNEGPGSGLYKSVDGGDTWTELMGHGLPAKPLGRIGLAVAPGQPRTVYALVSAKDGGLFRSDDFGATWTRESKDERILGRSWYFSGITVDPRNANVVYCPNVSLYKSTDSGQTFTPIKGAPGGDDYHFLWIDPVSPAHMILASDQGTVVSLDGGASWSSWFNQPTAQFYHVITDNQFPYFVYGAQQDSGTAAVASRTDFGNITFRDWYPVGGGESGMIAPDPANPNVVYAGDTNGTLYRFDKRTGQSQDISPVAREGFGEEISQRKYRFTWTSPLVFSPHNPKQLYFGAQYVLRTEDEGMSWQTISPDLTGDERKSPAEKNPAPISTANTRARGYGVVYAIAPSPIRAGLIWAGSDSGLIHVTRDDGKTWVNVSPAGLGDWSKIGIIDASRHDADTAYAAVDRHRMEDYRPYIYRTHDGGKSWVKIADGIPEPAYVNAVREDPVRKGLLFAGTELGVYVSFDDGGHWQPLQLNLPAASVRDLVIHGNDLVIATHGRSFWILDDITPLRQMSGGEQQSTTVFFEPATAIRLRSNVNHDTPLPPETPAGLNPPEGAMLYYRLKSAARAVSFEILDSTGALIRKVSSGGQAAKPYGQLVFASYWLRPPAAPATDAGMHRWVWDLRYTAAEVGSHTYSMETAFGQDTPLLPRGPMALPGKYTVRLTVDGNTYTQPLTVVMDPRVTTSPADLEKQFTLSLKIRDALMKPLPKHVVGALVHLSAVVDDADRAPAAQAQMTFDELMRESVGAH